MKKIVLLLLICMSNVLLATNHTFEAGTYGTHVDRIYEEKNETTDDGDGTPESFFLRNNKGNMVGSYNKLPENVMIGIEGKGTITIPLTGLGEGEKTKVYNFYTDASSTINLGERDPNNSSNETDLNKDYDGGIKVHPYAKVFYLKERSGGNDVYYLGVDLWITVDEIYSLDSLEKSDLESRKNYINHGVDDNISFSTDSEANNGIKQNVFIEAEMQDYDTNGDPIGITVRDYMAIEVTCSVTLKDYYPLKITVLEDLNLGVGVAGDPIGYIRDENGNHVDSTPGYKEAEIRIEGAAHALVHIDYPPNVIIKGDKTGAALDVELIYSENRDAISHFGDTHEIYLEDIWDNNDERRVPINDGDESSTGGLSADDYKGADGYFYIDGEVKGDGTRGKPADVYKGSFPITVKYESELYK